MLDSCHARWHGSHRILHLGGGLGRGSCPIAYEYVDLGSPSWLAADPPLAKLKKQPIWFGISYVAEGDRIVITRVYEGSPAARAAIQKGDVVLAADGQAIHAQAELDARLDRLKPGDQAVLSVKRDTTVLELKASTEARDPLIFGLIQKAKSQECSAPSYERSKLLTDKRVEAAVFEKNHAFRCKDAHAPLMQTDLFHKGALVVVRGARRVLISSVGWQTTCVDAADYDGDVPDKRMKKLLETISSRYTEDRFQNP